MRTEADGGAAVLELTTRESRVLSLLMAGEVSVAEISARLGYCDPRGYIRSLRRKGVQIVDRWVTDGEVRYKRYCIG